MNPIDDISTLRKVTPRCPVFGTCGGCQYQDIAYADELSLKENSLKELFRDAFPGEKLSFAPIVASPDEYSYRSRLDIKLLKTKTKEVFIGFSPVPGSEFRQVVPVDRCPIAAKAVSDFIPQLKKEAVEKLPPKYRIASLVVKTGDDGRVFWGGIGKRSLRMNEEDYLWTEINGARIHYTLDSFFQANLPILPDLLASIERMGVLKKETHFFDIYGGVGLFSIGLKGKAGRITLLEENKHATKLAAYNAACNGVENFSIITAKAEESLPELLEQTAAGEHNVVMVDPPRAGLKPEAAQSLNGSKEKIDSLLYLSCSPEALIRDLKILKEGGWKIKQITPFDFFPKTKHLETLVWLE